MKIRYWVWDKINTEADRYGRGVDANADREWGTTVKETQDENGYVKVYPIEIIKETEKAINVKLAATSYNKSMSATTWTAWIPKSQIA